MANKNTVKTIDFKGKKYAEVKERIKAFRESEQYSDYGIDTHMLEYEADKNVVVKAIIMDKDGRIVATGLANETPDSVMKLMKNSFVEVCETSAVGRALAFLGFVADGEIASYDEIVKARVFENDVLSEIEHLKDTTELKTFYDKNKKTIEVGLKSTFNFLITEKKTELQNKESKNENS